MIEFKIKKNTYLNKEIQAFAHCEYHGSFYKIPFTIESKIVELKNTYNFSINYKITRAKVEISEIIKNDLLYILKFLNIKHNITIVTVPRSKANFSPEQLMFNVAVKDAVISLGEPFIDGTNYILRHTNTRTTHLRDGGDGYLPYKGITKDSCTISPLIYNKDIILIDDVYTENTNIDEDCIMALLERGAKTIIFYSIGRTVR